MQRQLVIGEIEPVRLRAYLNEAIHFRQIKRTKKGEVCEVSIPCPRPLAKDFMEFGDVWTLRSLNGVAEAPFMRPDGTIAASEGYDPATGIILDLNGMTFPEIRPIHRRTMHFKV